MRPTLLVVEAFWTTVGRTSCITSTYQPIQTQSIVIKATCHIGHISSYKYSYSHLSWSRIRCCFKFSSQSNSLGGHIPGTCTKQVDLVPRSQYPKRWHKRSKSDWKYWWTKPLVLGFGKYGDLRRKHGRIWEEWKTWKKECGGSFYGMLFCWIC